MSSTQFKIDLNEPFERLAKAPIVETVIEWRARPEKELDSVDFLNMIQDCTF